MDNIANELVSLLLNTTTDSIYLDQCGDTYEIEADSFSITFAWDGESFAIHSIDTRGNKGLGRLVVGIIHDLCDDHGLDVCAHKVLTEARGFWLAMGYQEGSEGSEFFRAA